MMNQIKQCDMSKRQTIITVEPPQRIRKEVFGTAPVVCSYCNGQGGFPRQGASGSYMERCPDCDGTGEVFAVVTVDWQPYSDEGKAQLETVY